METQILAGVAVAILGFALVSRRAERWPVTPPLCFLLFGWLVGGHGLGWLEFERGHQAIQVLAELALVLVLFTDASRIQLKALQRDDGLPLRLLGVGLPLCVLAGAAGAMLLFPELGAVEALLLGAILAPTDAALGQAVVSSPLVPVRIRQSLNVESGLNDGIALPLVLVAASLAGAIEASGSVAEWARFALLQLSLGPVVGVAVGAGGARLLERAVARGWVSQSFEHLGTLSLAFLAFGGAQLVGGNGFIAAFTAGLALGQATGRHRKRLQAFAEDEGQLLTLLVFLIFGATMVPLALAAVGVRELAYALLSLSLIRGLPVALAMLGFGLRLPTTLFLAWFGPRGLASILFVLILVEGGAPEGGVLKGGRLVEHVVVLTVFLSTLLHGISAYPLARRYGAWAERAGDVEIRPSTAVETPVRLRHGDRDSP